MTTACVTAKSSAVSVWILPTLDGRESVAIFPSGSPVEKEKEAADARETRRSKASAPTAVLPAESAPDKNRTGRSIAGRSFIVFGLFRSFFITGSFLICLCASDWDEWVAPHWRH